jgi:metal-responsive CopG/Arc/MetJ family transcriptional regulator
MPAKRVLISIDERLLARVDERAGRHGMSRSAYLAQLADADLQAAHGPGADPSVQAALRAIDALLAGEQS